MKDILYTLSVIVISCSILVGCNDKQEPDKIQNNTENPNTEEEQDVNENEDNENIEESNKEETDTSSSALDSDVEDQLDLQVGDTGVFDTTLGTYEMTVDSAEVTNSEIDGISPKFDNFILLDITIKNISEQVLDLDDLMVSMEATDNLDMAGYTDSSGIFDSIEEITGTIEPGETVAGQFITESYDSDEYFFRKNPGNVAGGSSNQVIWKINTDEAR
ncbi:DUF4352 domain-containing protein [Ornithinibacillus sp. L9]|uniref:DUF4352 domain-containing protein n=1 Tax=Ornithinibacillus caprae TaxID=2678566 RepID=A0A6N8FG64_9BACI|nr:DUF4352 domain-containing protein [Ornithinibacillus caprae]MUK87037.1 DUF4352 domain-containing protein [Ornithinibacillus caprae]